MSSKRNMYVLKRSVDGRLILRPTQVTKWVALLLLVLAFFLFAVGLYCDWPVRLQIGITLFPVFGAAAYGLIYFFTRNFGLYAEINPVHNNLIVCHRSFYECEQAQQISITDIAAVTLAFTETVSTRFSERRQTGPGNKDVVDVWDSFRLALVLQNGDTVTLLESGGRRSLEKIGAAIANAMQKPFKIMDRNEL